ncbi:MAG TPA: hypothetical protein VF398_09675, partial [bacterium]
MRKLTPEGGCMKNLFKVFVLFTGSVLFSLLIGEIAVRMVAPQQLIDADQDIWRTDNQLGYRHKEWANTFINNGEGRHRFITDQHGYRVTSPNTATPTDSAFDASLLIIGDSFLEAVSVDNDSTIPQLLAKNLQIGWRKRVFAANPGTSGWNVNHYYLEAKRSLALRHFDLGIVFLFLGNDIVESVDTLARTAQASVQLPATNLAAALSEWRTNFSGSLEQFLAGHSELFLFIKMQAYAHFSRIGIITRKDPKEFFVSERGSRRWKITSEICTMIQHEFNRYGTPVFFVLLPPVYQVNVEYFDQYASFHKLAADAYDLDQPNKIL